MPGLPDLTNQFTIALWARSAGATWSNYGVLASRRPQFVLHPWAGSGKTISLIVYDPAGTEQRADFNLVDINGFDLTEWHHYAGSYEAATGRATLYVDGRLRATANLGPTTLKSDTGPLALGWDDGFSGRYFAGELDEVRLYARALATNEVVALASGFDDDQDGLTDEFERGLIESSQTDAVRTLADVTPQGDFDGDGANNLEELVAGTDAASAGDRFQITAIRRGTAPGTVEVTLNGKSGRRYTCETSVALGAGGWQVVQQLGPLAGDAPVVFTHTAAAPGPSFYRVRVAQ